MKTFKIIVSLLLITYLISCGRNERNQQELDFPEATTAVPSNLSANIETRQYSEQDTISENAFSKANSDSASNSNTDSGLVTAIQNQILNPNTTHEEKNQNNTTNLSAVPSAHAITKKEAEVIINSPLRNLLKNAEMGKTYSKIELIEKYKFPKEAVDLIKKVTCVGPNKLYFNWGSTWLVEKVSDAEFKNDTMIFVFKKNKTYVSGGAIGIKYNKKIYTDLILNNGSAYIPSVKGYHWEINK